MPFVGSISPEFMSLTIAAVGGFNLAEVTSAEVTTTLPNGQTIDWAWSVAGATPQRATLRHTFSSDGQDATQVGVYRFAGTLITPTVRRRFEPVSVTFTRFS